MSDELLVTVDDANRARDWFDQAVADGLIRRGSVKDYPLVQMLAKHRVAATIAAFEEAAKLAEAMLVDDLACPELGIADALRARASRLRMEVE